MSPPSSANQEHSRVLLTGRPGCGKTTVIRRTVNQLGAKRCLGFYTEEVRERGRRIGFDVVTLAGVRIPLARSGGAGPRVGHYGVDVAAFERTAVAPLEGLPAQTGRVLILDEIGKMELFSPKFVSLLGLVLDPLSAWAVLGTVMRGRHPVVDRLRKQTNIHVVEVNQANREALPSQLAEIFGS